jgi:hypothetical protein
LGDGAIMRVKRPARVNIGLAKDAQRIALAPTRIGCDTAASQYRYYVGDGIDPPFRTTRV